MNKDKETCRHIRINVHFWSTGYFFSGKATCVDCGADIEVVHID